MIGEAALNGLFQWLPQGLFDIGKWGLGRRWGAGERINKRKRYEEEQEQKREELKKRRKPSSSFLLKHKLVLEQSGSSFICIPPRANDAEASTLESPQIVNISIGLCSPLGKKACNYASVKDPIHCQASDTRLLKHEAKEVSLVCSGQYPPAATTTAFFESGDILSEESDDDEALSPAVVTAASSVHPSLETLKGQLKLVLDKGPRRITAQDQFTFSQLCKEIEQHPAYSTADHGPMWALRHLSKSFADILILRNSCRGLADANSRYAHTKLELRDKKARARESLAEIERRTGEVERGKLEIARLKAELETAQIRLKEAENALRMGKDKDAALLTSLRELSNSFGKARSEKGKLQREAGDLTKKLAEADAAVQFLHSWLSL